MFSNPFPPDDPFTKTIVYSQIFVSANNLPQNPDIRPCTTFMSMLGQKPNSVLQPNGFNCVSPQKYNLLLIKAWIEDQFKQM